MNTHYVLDFVRLDSRIRGGGAGSSSVSLKDSYLSVICKILVLCSIMYITYIMAYHDKNNQLDRKLKHITHFIHTFYCTGYSQHTLQQFWKKKWGCWCWKDKSCCSEIRLVCGESWLLINSARGHGRLRWDLSLATKDQKVKKNYTWCWKTHYK